MEERIQFLKRLEETRNVSGTRKEAYEVRISAIAGFVDQGPSKLPTIAK